MPWVLQIHDENINVVLETTELVSWASGVLFIYYPGPVESPIGTYIRRCTIGNLDSIGPSSNYHVRDVHSNYIVPLNNYVSE